MLNAVTQQHKSLGHIMTDEKPIWHFLPHAKGQTVRDPIQGEFFSTEAIEDAAEALIREGIQNSLDARKKQADGAYAPLRVRVGVYSGTSAAGWESIEWLMNGNWGHIHASGNGLSEAPAATDPCAFVTFEDFGTSGLEGDPGQWEKIEGERNNFFNFFRAEGHSDKSETDRGRWGVGKTVFPRSSRISSFWALTCRASDGAKLLFGRTILKHHKVNGSSYLPDGYFGLPDDEGLVHPSTSGELVQRFCDAFNLHRSSEPGLSIVVPYFDDSGINTDRIRQAVIVGYFFPILTGELSVEIAGPDGTTTVLDRTNLVHVASEFDRGRGLMSVIKLAAWAEGLSDSELLQLVSPPVTRAPKWSAELFPAKSVEALRKAVKAGERVAIRVLMPVRQKGKEAVSSFFDVYLIQDGSDRRGRPIYVRDGITISDVRGRTTHGVASLVLVTDKPLSTLLGDSENPAHTQWQKDCSHYRNKYEAGVANIDFVANSVAEILRLVTESDVEEDPSVLIDLFSLPKPRKDDKTKSRKKKPSDTEPESSPDDPPKLPPPKPKAFRVTKSKGGFSITNGDEDAPIPERLLVEVAYDDRTSNPLRSWYRTDFDIGKLKMTAPKELPECIKVISASGNQLLLEVLQPQFRVNVSGFDERRNLYVRALEKEAENGD